jgi:hypothetical protein
MHRHEAAQVAGARPNLGYNSSSPPSPLWSLGLTSLAPTDLRAAAFLLLTRSTQSLRKAFRAVAGGDGPRS